MTKPNLSYGLARELLKDDFITPEEVAGIRNVQYYPWELQNLHRELPPERILKWCLENCYVVLPGPSGYPSSLNEVVDLYPNYFPNIMWWYYDERFSFKKELASAWICIRKGYYPQSLMKTWAEQQNLLTDEERVPSAGEVAWAYTTYKELRKKELFEANVYLRTSTAARGRRVFAFTKEQDLNGIYTGDYHFDVGCGDENDRDEELGVSSVRK